MSTASNIVVIVPDGLVTVDGDARRIDMSFPGIKEVLRKEPALRALRWEGATGYLERSVGLSHSTSDKKLVEPFLQAHRAAMRLDIQKEKDNARSIKAAKDAEAKKLKDEEAESLKEQAHLKAEALKQEAYQQASALLASSDITVTRLYEKGLPVPDSWQTYREALRSIVRQAPPNPKGVKWPKMPPKPKGLS